MGKGFILLVGIGGLFAYFVFNFVGNVERDTPSSQEVQSRKAEQDFARYYIKDAAGYPVLALGNTPLSKAREVWGKSPILDDVLELFPRFDLMKKSITLHVEEGDFRRYLLKRLDEVESQYLGGTIDPDRAKEMIRNL